MNMRLVLCFLSSAAAVFGFLAGTVALLVAHSIPPGWNSIVGWTGYAGCVTCIPFAFLAVLLWPRSN